MTPQEQLIKLFRSYNPDLPMAPGMKAQFLELRERVEQAKLIREQVDGAVDSQFLQDALACGAELTGKPDGSESVTVVFTPFAWRQFARLTLSTHEDKTSPDANVERNRQLLLQRSIVGLEKYGVTTERDDLDLAQWLQHLLEELLDAANYIQAAKHNLKGNE